MAQVLYCWRCRTDIPMLDEEEWEQVAPLLSGRPEDFRRADDAAPREGARTRGAEALDRYFLFTGFRETNPNAVWHHRVSLFGPPCSTCGKPLRTPQARMCAECGAPA